MPTPFNPVVVPFSVKGLVLKKDVAQLQDGELSEATNITSIQEGVITQRPGNRRVTAHTGWIRQTGPISLSLIHTINKLRTSSTTDVFYCGNGGEIFRATGPLAPTGATQTFHSVAGDCADVQATYDQQRFSLTRYNSGANGTPYAFIGAQRKMLKDTGFLNSGDGSGIPTTIIQRWGILPPTQPVQARLDQITLLPQNGAGTPLAVVDNNSRINTTILSVSGTGPGLVAITPVSMSGIIVGLLVKVGAINLGIVEQTTSTSFQVYLPGTPVAGQQVISGFITDTPTAAPGTVTVIPLPGGSVSPVPANFDGQPDDGYETDDVVHVAIGISQPDLLTDLRIRVMVNSASGTDYYEKEILPSQLQMQASVLATATQTLPGVATNVATGVSGNFDIADPTATSAKAEELAQVGPDQSTSVPVWTEIDIPKPNFLPVGLAGQGKYNWANVVGFQIVSVGDPSITLWIGNIYIAGGFGPNAFTTSFNAPLNAYSYAYTYRNTITGFESNPCTLMLDTNTVTPLRQRVKLTLISSSDNQISGAPANPSAPTTNNAAIAVYRSGGAFSDGLYRFLGYAINSVDINQIPQVVTFVDSQSDASIINAPIISFDNDPPVLSTLPTPLTASFVSYTAGTGKIGVNAFKVNIISGLSTTDLTSFLRVGSTLTIAPNTSKQETAYVIAVSPVTITAYFQYDHTDAATLGTSVFVSCDAVCAQPARFTVAAFDAVFCAGDQNNPHVLYKSKNGRPEAFPVEEFNTGVFDQINVGSPSNAIMNITEFNGEILCMNLEKLYLVAVFEGQMQSPVETLAERGLYGSMAWCRAQNEIWYLGYDGIYSWSGGRAVKRSEAIDPLFHGYTIGPYEPIDLTGNSNNPGAITGVTITSGGSFYGFAPQVVFSGGGGSGATATATVSGGQVTSVTITNGGSGYTSTPLVSFIEPGGSGASGTVQISLPEIAPKDIITMMYSKQRIYMVYAGISGSYHRLRYDMLYDRWSMEDIGDLDPHNPVGGVAVTAQYAEQDDGFRYDINSSQTVESNTLIAKSVTLTPNTTANLYFDDVGTSEGWINAYSDGAGIAYAFESAAYTAGQPSINKQFADYVLETNNDGGAINVQVTYDYSLTPDPTDSVTLAAGAAQGRRRIPQRFQNGFGKEAYAIQMRFSGTTTTNVNFYTNTFNVFSLDQIQVGRAFDWDDLGTPDDKRLYEISIWYDMKSTPHTWTMDTITGITNSQVVTQGVQSFTLEPLTGTFTGPSWTQVTFPINDGTIVKKIRLRPTTLDANAQIVRKYKISFEKYPPDVLFWTEWSDLGHPYEKVARNLVMNIDTAGVPCTIQIQADGTTRKTITVTTNFNDRERIIGLNSEQDPRLLVGRLWRIVLTPGNGGKAQVFTTGLDYIPEPAELVWYDSFETNMGYPGWKALKECWLTYWSSGPLTVTFYVENAVEFYQLVLPAHANRDTERFYFPAKLDGVLNKSRNYRFQLSTPCPDPGSATS
jgi:hypothetical protein